MSVLCIIPIHKPHIQNFIQNLSQIISIDLVVEVRVCASNSTDISFLKSVNSSKLVILCYHSYGQIHQRAFAYSNAPISSKYVLNLDQDISISDKAVLLLYSALENNDKLYSASVPCISLNSESFSRPINCTPGYIYRSGYAQSPSSDSVPVLSSWTKGGCTLWRSSYAFNLFIHVNLPRCTWSPCEDLIYSFTSHDSFDHLVLFSHFATHSNDCLSGQPFSLRLVWKGINIVLWRLLFVSINRHSFEISKLYLSTFLRILYINYCAKICISLGYSIALLLFLPLFFFKSEYQQKILAKYIVFFDRRINLLE